MEQQGGLVGPVQLEAFLAVDIGEKHPSVLIEALHQHHADVGQALGVDGRERHGGRIARLAAGRFFEPRSEQAQRLVRLGEITTR